MMLLDGKENAISVLLFPFQSETVPDNFLVAATHAAARHETLPS